MLRQKFIWQQPYINNKSQTSKKIIEEYAASNDSDLALIAMDNIQNMKEFKDFMEIITQVHKNTKGVRKLSAVHSSTNTLLIRLNEE